MSSVAKAPCGPRAVSGVAGPVAAPPSADARANPASPSSSALRRNISTIAGAGRGRPAELARILERVRDNLLGTLTPEERRQFVRLLARVLDGQGDRG